MRLQQGQSGADPEQEQDPLSQHTSPTLRRFPRRGGAAPQGNVDAANQNPDHPAGADDLTTRQLQRLQRQGGARAFPSSFGNFTRNINNTQLGIGMGVIIAALVLLLFLRGFWRNNDASSEGLTSLAAATQTVEAQAVTNQPGPIDNTAAGPIVTVVPQVPLQGEQTTAPASAGPAFVVTGTATEGLFLRDAPSTSGGVLATLPEGTRVESLGEEQNDGTRTWRKVRAQQGEGWVAADFLAPAP